MLRAAYLTVFRTPRGIASTLAAALEHAIHGRHAVVRRGQSSLRAADDSRGSLLPQPAEWTKASRQWPDPSTGRCKRARGIDVLVKPRGPVARLAHVERALGSV